MARALSDMLAPPLAELSELEELIAAAREWVDVRTDAGAHSGPTPALPVHTVSLGAKGLQFPAVGFFGGVHGLERIGSRLVLAYLRSLISRLPWDVTLQRQLERVRLVFMPVVNPGGMARGTRANPAGVDLMRNAPVDASESVPFLVGGHRLGRGLPWYRGRAGDPLQPESAAVCRTVDEQLLARPFSIALDCHSGFGLRDRVWFPFAGRRTPFTHAPQLRALCGIFDDSHPHHPYVFEPQSRQYLAHGDLWDHLALAAPVDRIFLPLTLEMGSWLWVKKNPRQAFSRHGIFNPVIAHREQRVLRRHLPLMDFLVRSAISSDRWLPRDQAAVARERSRAMERWYRTGR